jgi:hypothetical protein
LSAQYVPRAMSIQLSALLYASSPSSSAKSAHRADPYA